MRTLTTLLVLFFALHGIDAQPDLRFVEPVSGFSSPVDITGAGDGSERLFIVEQDGTIKIYDQSTNTTLATDFLDITDRVRFGGERGLLGLAFHPEFATNGHFYVNYTTIARNGLVNGTTVIARFTAAIGANTVDPNTEEVVLSINQVASNHNAGDLAFGPDGYLYIPTGDGGGGGDPDQTGQDPMALLGKMLRIDVDNPVIGGTNYGIPADNPFVGNAGVRDEIWALGLRNPWRISFDRQTGDLWIADVGQGQREEVNFEAAGSAGGMNFGWDCREGLLDYPAGTSGSPGTSSPNCVEGTTYDEPVFDYPRSSSIGGFSITGGFLYRGSADDLVGYYICADFASSNFFLYPPGGGTLLVDGSSPAFSPSTFGEDDNGELYVFSYGGTFYRVTTLRSMPVELTAWTAEVQDKVVVLSWQTGAEVGAADYVIERSSNGVDFSTLATVIAAGTTSEATDYTYTDVEPLGGRSYYRLRQRDLDGAEELFPVRSVIFRSGSAAAPTITPNPTQRDLSITIPELQENGPVNVQIFATDGRRVFEHVRLDEAGRHQYDYILPELPAGVYRVVVRFDGEAFQQNLVIR
ncbi:PQQ-dependent sugar dehydrogenase [Neolewinella persica]|uniref:PQQ-dependent sugar dehydrogenase n=1 Tax=Neolewinella persica TaxID=70998 RepID=UPI00039ED660|nr:PQQ-dependent sugar dehydrogenase [Neolewinella persica]